MVQVWKSIGMKFCSRCGHRLSQKLMEGRTRRVCESCGHVPFYRQLKVGAGVIVERDGDVLLMRRGAGALAFPGTWCLPAGYCEHDEAPKQTAAREAKEETGLEVAIGGIFGIFFIFLRRRLARQWHPDRIPRHGDRRRTEQRRDRG